LKCWLLQVAVAVVAMMAVVLVRVVYVSRQVAR
jgi:hypothetical protein